MDLGHLEHLRDQLKKHFDAVALGGPATFQASMQRLGEFILAHEVLRQALWKVHASAPFFESELFLFAAGRTVYLAVGKDGDNIPLLLRAVQKAYYDPSWALTVGARIRPNSDDDARQNAFYFAVVHPIYVFLDAVLAQNGTIEQLLLKYKRSVEWFNLRTVAKQATKKVAERHLAPHLHEYLFDQGLDLHVEPKSRAGRVDLVATNMSLDVKVFDGVNRGLTYVRDGFHQVYTYLNDYNQTEGYLVVYRATEKELHLTGGHLGGPLPFIQIEGKRVYMLVVDIFVHTKSASKRGAMSPYELKSHEIVEYLHKTK